jgi:asparagine synthase (glutamine-hydrolysing)
MCGVLGWIDPRLTDRNTAMSMAGPALSALRARGPDDHRLEWGAGWILGHTRLAIIDLSSRSSQPMTRGNGLWLAYNGEIYNFRELRAELERGGCRFESEGDAEVLLNALKSWGVAALERLRGMFAFALIDTERREVLLARDRYGVKPLAYELNGSGIRFASDLNALRKLPDASRDIDAEAAYLFMALGYVPAAHTIHRNVRKVKPGHYIRARWSDAGVQDVTERPYWSMRTLASQDASAQTTREEATDEFERRLSDAVRRRLVSDVPVGTLLSGGVDSTLVTAFSREVSNDAIPAFTMGFDDPAFDESPFARAIAQQLGGDHRDYGMTSADADRAFATMWSAYDEPFADASAIPTMELSRHVASNVKVALSGDGGDETGCGYAWHHALNRLDSKGEARGLSRSEQPRMLRFLHRHGIPLDREMDRAAVWSVLRTGLSDDMARTLPVADAPARKPLSEYFREWSSDLSDVDDCFMWSGLMDLLTYVPDDLMVKSDRASMRVGLELRQPLLDHQLTAWLMARPLSMRFDRDTSTAKVLPRRALARRISPQLLDRPKRGFTPPLAKWLADPLCERMRDALERLEKGLLDPIALPAGGASQRDSRLMLRDGENEFVWRILCFSEWNRHALDA